MGHSGSGRIEFVLLGGFLGAGKTTTLCAVGKALTAGGRRVAVITNDQATDLVDSDLARWAGLPVGEIAGGCFCCRFQDLVERCDEIIDAVKPDIILAEPVGSCTDLSATVIQPLKQFYGERFVVQPYAVLVDPERVRTTLLGPLAQTDLGYLFRKQLEEADQIVLNKLDLLDPAERDALVAALREAFGGTDVAAFSALTGAGIDAWYAGLSEVGQAGRHILEVDYDTYAEAEAALGWLNAKVALTSTDGFDGAALATELLEAVRAASRLADAEVGHAKLLLSAPEGMLRAALVSNGSEVSTTGELSGPVREGLLTVNARVTLSPEQLEATVREAVAALAAKHGASAEIGQLQSFRPGRPTPTHRFAESVG